MNSKEFDNVFIDFQYLMLWVVNWNAMQFNQFNNKQFSQLNDEKHNQQ